MAPDDKDDGQDPYVSRALAEPQRTPPPKPDWSKWGLYLESSLDEAIALSVDMAPEAFRHGIHGDLLTEYFRWIDVARNHIQSGQLKKHARMSAGRLALVVIFSEFVEWCDRVRFGLPPEFRDAVKATATAYAPTPTAPVGVPAAETPDDVSKPIATKERTTLLAIIGGIAKAADFDISQPTVAAKAIVKALDESGAKIGQRTVENALKEVADAIERKGY